ncbi:glycoside hydrolase family 32 protein [Pantoea sp. 1.19]|uniref:glycoside hydrolase family 32 protein n=1 Tax=Pantoea sp. 1.19 TaxID=1925589 RepID=UPI000948D7F4|nr:glycoside hydrolase family 32 protein [Pantoea sp. 1.19]
MSTLRTSLAAAHAARDTLLAGRGERFYPQIHLAPPAGWMNDPNGLIYWQGRYHVFYQHHPLSADWGPMHWGHMTSDDLVSWQHQPIALAPGDEADRDGCFSGCAVDDNGVLSLIYTGHVWLAGEGNDAAIREVQCLATSRDGIHFDKQGAVLTPPPGIMHFRDPKVWREGNRWMMVVGARDGDDVGQVLLYSGDSLRDWHYEGVLAKGNAGDGYMWECPDFFPLGDRWVLLFSPQGIAADGYRFRNRFQSGYLSGHWQPGGHFCPDAPFRELDAGHDFYAPQTLIDAQGRRIVFGWMDMWESPMPGKADGWAGSLTLPRVLTLAADGALRMSPLPELAALRGEGFSLPDSSLRNQTLPLPAGHAPLELTFSIDRQHSSAERMGLVLSSEGPDGAEIRLYVDAQAGRLVLDRGRTGHGVTGCRSVALPPDETLRLQIFLDRSSLEVFINEGTACLTSRLWPSAPIATLSLFAEDGDARFSALQGWPLRGVFNTD